MAEVNVRPARKGDMPHVFRMIKGLAEYEHMSDQVRIDESVLIRDGFGPGHPAFFCYVAEIDEDNVIGYALGYYYYSTWNGKCVFLEDFYVESEYRKQGIGKKLFMTVAKLAYDTNSQMDFNVLSWNPAIGFYEKVGAVNLTKTEKWHGYRLDKNGLDKLFR